MNSILRTLSLGRRGILNYAGNGPMCVSFEITHNCNASCKHCHRRGIFEEERATPERFGEICRELKPVVTQVSGGEPLLRKDVYDIVRALRQSDGTPYIVFVTNAALLTTDAYHRLLEAGVDVFSVSLDYPDERHDEFRRIPGLFGRIGKLAASLNGNGGKAITLNSVVQSDNFRELVKMAEVARDWGVDINFSPYTWLRTNDMGYMISEEDLPAFRDIIDELIAFKNEYGVVRTTNSFFNDMYDFFKNRSIPDCKAGERFLVVNPDGSLSPCGLIMTSHGTLQELRTEFSANNTCTFCHTCIRASTEKPFNNLIRGGLKSLFVQ